MASGEGFEPPPPGSEPGILPVRRSRNTKDPARFERAPSSFASLRSHSAELRVRRDGEVGTPGDELKTAARQLIVHRFAFIVFKAEAVGVEPTGGGVSAPATLAGSLPYPLARLPGVARREGRCGSRTRRGVSPHGFRDRMACRVPNLPRDRSARIRTEIGWIWSSPCCALTPRS